MKPKPFDLLAEYGKFGAEKKLSLRDPQAAAAFTEHVDDAVKRALGDQILLHGQRTEAMFEALVISLGAFRLLKPEDGGRLFPSDQFRAADFRIVLEDGEQWLVEVKNVYEDGPIDTKRRLMKHKYRAPLEAYAAATGATLKLAVYWARWSIWTLVSPDRLADENGDVHLDMGTALKVNELGRLGDLSVGTRPPLRLRLSADPTKTSPIAPDGTARFTVGKAQVFCADKEVTDATDQEIAWIFIQHGQWVESGPEVIMEDDRLKAIEFTWEPRERLNEGFEIVGTLSNMFARYYAEHTIDEREVVQLRAPLRPNWFAPLVSSDRISEALPLWRIIQRADYSGIDDVERHRGR